MNIKKRRARVLFIFIMTLCVFLSSCSNQMNQSSSSPSLPPVNSNFQIPFSGDISGYVMELNIYLPTANSSTLESLKVNLAIAHDMHPAEAAIKKLLSYSGNEKFQPLLDKAQIGLLSSIEISSNVACVNLSANVHQLSSDEQMKVCQAITNTLCQFNDISYVNILCNNKAIGIKRENDMSVDGLFQFKESSYQSNQGPTRLIGFYLPNKKTDGLTLKAKTIKITTADKKQLSTQILNELSNQIAEAGFDKFPNINNILARNLTISEATNKKGSVLNLDFKDDAINFLLEAGLSKEKLISSICMTLTSFIPDLHGIKVNFGREQIKNLKITNPITSDKDEISFENDVISRKYFSSYILSPLDIYAPNSEKGLTKEEKLLPYSKLRCPEFILDEILKENIKNGTIITLNSFFKKSNILAFARKDDTLLLNLSHEFLSAVEKLDETMEKQMVYSLVNSFCSINGIRRIRFFSDGKSIESYKGKLFMNGEFLFNPEI